jgi:L-ornithine N5-oxygenase
MEDKGTNYGVVRLNLLEHIYETLYMQRIRYGNSPEEEAHWPHRIMPHRRVIDVEDSPVRKDGIRLHVRDSSPLYLSEEAGATEQQEMFDVDAVFVATGYFRDLHETLLKDARHLMPGGDLLDAKWTVQRDYRINFENKRVSDEAGVWLQGCCETTHGVSFSQNVSISDDQGLIWWQLSDTLLSVLATRGGEMVRAIFEKPSKWDSGDVLGGYEERQ